MPPFCSFPSVESYWLLNATIPHCLLDDSIVPSIIEGKGSFIPHTDGFSRLNLQISGGKVRTILPAEDLSSLSTTLPTVDLRGGQVWPCFIDMHTHLDKGHSWERSPNPNGSFQGAMAAVRRDAVNCHEEDLYRRMEFGLLCSYAHGTSCLRTHLDSPSDQMELRFDVFTSLQKQWQGRLTLQSVCLVGLDEFLTPFGEKLSDRVSAIGGVLGGVAWMDPELDNQLHRVFALAHERRLDLDFHVDETHDPNSCALKHVALIAERYRTLGYSGRITCGHCCSLAVQPPAVVRDTLERVRGAGIAIVSLPLCNLYLQDRHPGHTPYWRGTTLLHELKAANIPVALASDNCRDPFFAYGDHDGLEVFTHSVRIGHLDHPIGDWPRAVTATPASLMGLTDVGRIGVGLSADLVCFRARYYSELLSRPQSDRVVLRQGIPVNTELPDYETLDDLMGTTSLSHPLTLPHGRMDGLNP